MEFILVNNRNIDETITTISNFDGYKMGFEVINPTIIDILDTNIDPQHTGVKLPFSTESTQNVSAVKWVLQRLESCYPEEETMFVVEKADIDSISSLALYVYAEEIKQLENDPIEHGVFLQLCEKVNEIDLMDCGIGNTVDWDPQYYKTQLKGVTQFNVLGAMCSDFKTPLNIKTELMRRWLVEDVLPEHYRIQQEQEFEKIKESTIDYPYGITMVETTARNVSSIIYANAPFGVAFNPEFPTPNGKVKKFTIMEFTGGKYLNLQGILDELNLIENGWGGNLNAGIVGSPFAGTELTPELVCSIVSKHVL